MEYPNGDKFEGRFTNDERAEGVETLANGTKISAKYKNDQKDGDGRVFMTDGFTLSGPFRNNELHGRVTVKDPKGKLYHVDFKYGKQQN